MSFDPKILDTVLARREAEQAQRKLKYEMRRESVYAEIPEIKRIDSEMQKNMSRLALSVFSGGGSADERVMECKEKNALLKAKRSQLLAAAGYPEDYLELRPRCPYCGDTGYIGSSPCSCLTEDYRAEQIKELSYLLDTKDNNFDTYRADYYSDETDDCFGISPRENMDYICDKCWHYASTFGFGRENLLLTGAPGLGKTFLSGCIADLVAKSGYSVVYDTAIHVLSAYEESKFSSSPSENSRLQIHRIEKCDLLILDDLGTEMHTAFTSSCIYDIVNTRILAKKPMIINTNLSPDEIAARYGEHTASRLRGEFTVLRFFGEDIRMIKKREREEMSE